MRSNFSFRSLQIIAGSLQRQPDKRPIPSVQARLLLPPPEVVAKKEEFGEYTLAIGEVKTFNFPVILLCHNIGAGLGVFIQDKSAGITGGAHILLPGKDHGGVEVEGAYYNTGNALARIFDEFGVWGSKRAGVKAWIAGGATFFGFGRQNVQAVTDQLAQQKVSIVASDVGGKYCRTVRFNSHNSMMLVQSSGSTFYRVL